MGDFLRLKQTQNPVKEQKHHDCQRDNLADLFNGVIFSAEQVVHPVHRHSDTDKGQITSDKVDARLFLSVALNAPFQRRNVGKSDCKNKHRRDNIRDRKIRQNIERVLLGRMESNIRRCSEVLKILNELKNYHREDNSTPETVY